MTWQIYNSHVVMKGTHSCEGVQVLFRWSNFSQQSFSRHRWSTSFKVEALDLKQNIMVSLGDHRRPHLKIGCMGTNLVLLSVRSAHLLMCFEEGGHIHISALVEGRTCT